MSATQILRAWRDHDYWLSLSESERAQVPENPAGMVELLDAELEHVTGGHTCPGEFTCDSSCTCFESCWGTCTSHEFSGGACCMC
jgi:mersacidin/lichenicidin family type 2 lantibiotic